jgi:hypothetical protein
MKRIRSNRKGRNIHSPFIYRLVANALFAPYPYYAFPEIEKMAGSRQECLYLKQLFRLVSFFDFERVIELSPVNPHVRRVCQQAKSRMHYAESDKIPGSPAATKESSYPQLVIFSEHNESWPTDRFPKIPEVWIFRKKNRRFPSNSFSELTLNQEVQITIESGQMGIVLFNQDFNKQNYVIKTSFGLPIRY